MIGLVQSFWNCGLHVLCVHIMLIPPITSLFLFILLETNKNPHSWQWLRMALENNSLEINIFQRWVMYSFFIKNNILARLQEYVHTPPTPVVPRLLLQHTYLFMSFNCELHCKSLVSIIRKAFFISLAKWKCKNLKCCRTCRFLRISPSTPVWEVGLDVHKPTVLSWKKHLK